ncbi:MAG: hypothetical protein Q7T33_09765 [Dehalococcoidia bacterium]|nr:hypothetical protein [Dehalococcoidia bacterium]
MDQYQIKPAPALWLDRLPDRQPSPGPAAAAPRPAGLAPDGPATAVASAAEAPSTAPGQAPATDAASPPAFAAPSLPAPPPETAAARLAREAGQRFGIRILLDGQDWGPDEASRQANIAAVISVMERLPQGVLSAVAGHPHGPLTFVSNMSGRTLDGWQPYGDFPMGFYTNSDQGAEGSHPANEVVLIPGFSDMSIGHEVLHAYHFRSAPPDRYAPALLGDEMRSFMAAAGWRQVGSDQQVLEATDGPWAALNSVYVYAGRPLTYATAAGSSVTLTPPNPLEAFAVAGSIYFTRPSGMPLPDWPEYWAWFSANLGSRVA